MDSPPENRRLAVFGLASIASIVVAPLLGVIAILTAQYLVADPNGLTLDYFSRLSRIGVLVQRTCFILGAVLAILSLWRREPPRAVAILGLVTNTVLIGMFWLFHYYALGFEQDLGAPS